MTRPERYNVLVADPVLGWAIVAGPVDLLTAETERAAALDDGYGTVEIERAK